MTFGQKIQSLRKENGMSQEQLAARLAVSRQAVSKWELDGAYPDFENIVQISQLFRVSTDYLMKEEAARETPLCPGKSAGPHRTLGLGVAAMGLVISCVGWRTFRTELAVGAGWLVQGAGVLLYALRAHSAETADRRKTFYAALCWLICPFPALFVSSGLLGLFPRPYPSWLTVLLAATLYLSACAGASFFLARRKNANRK